MRYGWAVAGSDLAALVASAAFYDAWGTPTAADNLVSGAVVVSLAVIGLLLARAWDPTVLGTGSVEFSRLMRGMLGATAVVGLLSLALQLPGGRPWAFGVLPLAGMFAVVGRLLLRCRLYRLHVATVDGMPLLPLTHPGFTGGTTFLKAALDRALALFILALISPLMLVLALSVALDGGPVFYRQKRVGLDGREFRMVKFRSMVVDAEATLAELQAADEGAGPLFKIRNDPRVTAIGRVLRKYALDELPQLFNVVGGSMSLVGPRPPLPSEVVGYARDARRRLLVKPGMTGLWQVSGRSNLSWEETVRLDIRYVENWTLALDAQILVRTVRAVLKGGGAS